MNLDDLLKQRRERLREKSRVRRQNDNCLSFAELERIADYPTSLKPAIEDHLQTCERCRTLRDRFAALREKATVEAELEEFDEEVRDTGPSGWEHRLWRIGAAASPFLTAACLVLAVAVWWPAPSPADTQLTNLVERIESTAKQADRQYFHLAEKDRAEWDTAKLLDISEQRRVAIEHLLDSLGDLIDQAREARRATDPATSNDNP